MGIDEIRWAKVHAKPRINPYRSLDVPESPDEYISLLERYLPLVPLLSPAPSPTSLSHPDLHLDNIFVNPDTKQISCIIDWQSASVSEPCFQTSIPRMLTPIASNSHKDATSQDPKATDGADRTADLLSHYQCLIKLKNEQRWAGMALHDSSPLIKPVSLLCGAWSRNDVFSFRHQLIYIAAEWEKIALSIQSCPMTFTHEELELHNSEMELLEGLGEVLHQLQNDNLIPLRGMVRRGYYEQALHINRTVKNMFVHMADSDSQRILYSRVWPYHD
jgi:hypothetical protein